MELISNEQHLMLAPAARTVRPKSFGVNNIRHRDKSALVEHLEFFGAFVRKPTDVGALLPSSPALARALLHGCHLKRARMVVELGPGTGAVTKAILQRVGHQTGFFALELDQNHTRGLGRRFPGLAVYHDSAENIRLYLDRHEQLHADYIISGLPWTNMKAAQQQSIMREIHAALAPGGLFTTFGYLHAAFLPAGRRFRAWLRQHFAQVDISRVVWRNVPPAFVYRCRQPVRA